VTRARTAVAAAALASILAGCAASGSSPTDVSDSGAEQVEASTDAAAPEADDGEAAPADESEETADQEPTATSDTVYLEELFAEALHEGITPAAPGTAYIEVAGQRFDFDEVTCSLGEKPGAEQLHIDVSEERSGSGHLMYIERSIGADIGWNWEDEFVQLAVLGEAEDGSPQMSNSLVQHDRPEDGDPKWHRGEGVSPLIRIVGKEVTTTGSLGGVPFAPEPLEGEFVAAATCP